MKFGNIDREILDKFSKELEAYLKREFVVVKRFPIWAYPKRPNFFMNKIIVNNKFLITCYVPGERVVIGTKGRKLSHFFIKDTKYILYHYSQKTKGMEIYTKLLDTIKDFRVYRHTPQSVRFINEN